MKDVRSVSQLFPISNPTKLLQLTGLFSAVPTAPTENGFVRAGFLYVYLMNRIFVTQVVLIKLVKLNLLYYLPVSYFKIFILQSTST